MGAAAAGGDVPWPAVVFPPDADGGGAAVLPGAELAHADSDPTSPSVSPAAARMTGIRFGITLPSLSGPSQYWTRSGCSRFHVSFAV
jgi:hypothetical protein